MKRTYRLKVEWSRLDKDTIDGDFLVSDFKTFYFTTDKIDQDGCKIITHNELNEEYSLVIKNVVGYEWFTDKIADIGPGYGNLDSIEFTIEPIEVIEV